MDAKPIAQTGKMVLTAGSRVSNTGFQWNDAHTRVANQGGPPSLIEPVTGTIALHDLQGVAGVTAIALDGSGRPLGETIAAKKTSSGWELGIGDPVTPWYLISVQR